MSVETINSKIDQVIGYKADIKAALQEKNSSITDDTLLADYAAKIRLMNIVEGDASVIIENLQAEVETLNSQVNSLTTENSTLTSQVETLSTENTNLTSQVSSLTSQVETLNTENLSLRGQVDTLTSENTELSGQVTTLTSEKETLTSDLETANTEIASLYRQMASNDEYLTLLNSDAAAILGEE